MFDRNVLIPFYVTALFFVGMVSCSGCEERSVPKLHTGSTQGEAAETFEGDAKNRLAGQLSPYLLQHAENPVDWFPWGEEAFAKAEKEDKPVFLSIGYATCHWCHVMAHESFEDEEVARLLNRSFVSIKVDREERPDIDAIYMKAAHITNGRGGWPLTIVMTPDKKPFFVATYIPKNSRSGRTGMLELIPQIAANWSEKRDDIRNRASHLTRALKKAQRTEPGETPGPETLEQGYRELRIRFDSQYGGFGRRTKFPIPHNLLFLLRYSYRDRESDALAMVEKTLQQMRYGGIFDHLGGGFHRYSTDRTWLVPHFEKMLYDQALLLLAYSETASTTRNEFYADVAREIVAYVKRDLTHPAGGFYSAEDADSEGVEGKFYLWSRDEIEAQLSNESAGEIVETFGIEWGGNFSAHETPPDTNILYLQPRGSRTPSEVVARDDALSAGLKKLFHTREQRVRPLLDDKILSDWNGLMIGALAYAGRVLEETEYIELAMSAEAFLHRELVDDGALSHRFRNGIRGVEGQLNDHGFVIFAYIELYEATLDPVYLERALYWQRQADELFLDPTDSSYTMSAKQTEDLLYLPKKYEDGAIPSGNSIMFYNGIRLSRLTGDARFAEVAHRSARAWKPLVERSASSHTLFLVGLDFSVGPSAELVVVGEAESEDTKALLRAARAFPRIVTLLKTNENAAHLEELAPYTRDQVALGGRATAYVCVEQACAFPTASPAKLTELIGKTLGLNK